VLHDHRSISAFRRATVGRSDTFLPPFVDLLAMEELLQSPRFVRGCCQPATTAQIHDHASAELQERTEHATAARSATT
jgi:hypothetical protein